jgi:hypothetical protein
MMSSTAVRSRHSYSCLEGGSSWSLAAQSKSSEEHIRFRCERAARSVLKEPRPLADGSTFCRPSDPKNAEPSGRHRGSVLPARCDCAWTAQGRERQTMKRAYGWKLVAGILVIGAASMLGGACGSDNTTFGNTGGSSSSGGTTNCELNGQGCVFGCTENLGCVECFNDSDCGAASPFCVLGRCEQCRTSADCNTGQVCQPDENRCDVPCTANGDCPGDTPTCHVPTGTCVECLMNSECPADEPICDPNRAQCGECITNADCGAAEPICNLQNGNCEQCLVNEHCPGGSICTGDHNCRAICTSNADCTMAGRPLCDSTSGSCVECLGNADCGAAEPICNSGGSCAVCIQNTDCKDPTRPVCRNGSECVACMENIDCKDPLLPVCKNEVCVECDNDEQCPMDKPKCDNSVCIPN